MAVHVGAREARKGFAELLGKVHFGRQAVIIERSGRPMVAMIPVDVYERLVAEHDAHFEVLDRVRDRLPEVSTEEIEPDAAETVTAMRAGNRVSSHSVTLPEITPVGCVQPVSEALPEAVERIVRELQPDRIILFGSYAHGSATPDSDVDLLVVMDTTLSGTERSWAVSRLLLPRSFPVDILVRTPQEIEWALDKGDFFIQEILTRGVVVYERSH